VFESIDAAGRQYLENLQNYAAKQDQIMARLCAKEEALDAVISGDDPNIDAPTAKYIARLLEEARPNLADELLVGLVRRGQKECVIDA
jgi:hypothetical protein